MLRSLDSRDARLDRICLRLSVTDRCNLRCAYCRPALGSGMDCRRAPLADAELAALVGAVDEVARVYKLRLTGGEPLLRPGLAGLVRLLRRRLPRAELALTTNGMFLAAQAKCLRLAGLCALNISLDTTNARAFGRLTRGGRLGAVLEGIRAARAAGFPRIKLNAVLMRSVNADRLEALVRTAAHFGAEIRFIELMPFGEGARLFDREYLSAREALERLRRSFAYLGPLPQSATARRHLLRVDRRDAVVGFIPTHSEPFCDSCDRIRMDCHGRLFTCLRSGRALEMAAYLRQGRLGALKPGIRAAIDAKTPPAAWPTRSMVNLGG